MPVLTYHDADREYSRSFREMHTPLPCTGCYPWPAAMQPTRSAPRSGLVPTRLEEGGANRSEGARPQRYPVPILCAPTLAGPLLSHPRPCAPIPSAPNRSTPILAYPLLCFALRSTPYTTGALKPRWSADGNASPFLSHPHRSLPAPAGLLQSGALHSTPLLSGSFPSHPSPLRFKTANQEAPEAKPS